MKSYDKIWCAIAVFGRGSAELDLAGILSVSETKNDRDQETFRFSSGTQSPKLLSSNVILQRVTIFASPPKAVQLEAL